jgi:hypothetical protein
VSFVTGRRLSAPKFGEVPTAKATNSGEIDIAVAFYSAAYTYCYPWVSNMGQCEETQLSTKVDENEVVQQ